MKGNMRMCKSESALRTLLPEKPVKRQNSTLMLEGLDTGKSNIPTDSNYIDGKKTEKVEKIMHLICWGPTLS